jgi:filamentous hemagglutinin
MTGFGDPKLSMPKMPQMFRQPLWKTFGYTNSRAMQMGSVSLRTREKYVGPMPPRVYSVAFEHRLQPSEYGLNQQRHFQLANEALKAERSASPWLAAAVPSPTKWGRPPEGWTWQHATIEQGRGAGLLQLVPKSQHTPGSPFWKLFHTLPGGAGGYWQWAVPAGAPPR